MALTFGTAREIVAKYAGRGGVCSNTKEAYFFTCSVLQHLLISGTFGNLRKFDFCSQKGCITVPYELETPLKVKIDQWIGTVWDKFFEWHPAKDLEDCVPAGRALFEEPNYFPTIYDLPEGGSRVGCMAVCAEAEGAQLVIKGVDTTGREIVTVHNGEQVIGEVITLRKGEIRYTSVTFGKITNVIKPQTNGYVQLFWVNPGENKRGFLSDYSPLEEIPQYRRFRLTDPRCQQRMRVSVFGRIRLKENYANDDVIPFESIYALQLAAQAMNASTNRAPDLAKASDDMMQSIVERENSFKKINDGTPMEVYMPTSAGAIRNIV